MSEDARRLGAIEIDRIEINGVNVFAQGEIESALVVSPGDTLERAKIVKSASNLQALYHARGYEQMRIQSRLERRKLARGRVESVLEFNVDEGAPTRVAAIHLTPDQAGDAAFRRYWDRLAPTVLARVGLAPGDIFDQEKLSAGKRAIQDLLAAEEFIGARIDDVRVSAFDTANASAPAIVRVQATPTARWVALEIRLDLGDRVSFGFRGNRVFTQAQLSGFIAEQRLLGFGKDYVEAIRRRIIDEYRSDGYAEVSVKPFVFEWRDHLARGERPERHVTFEIGEGARARIAAIDFDGNLAFGSPELRRQLLARASALLQNGYYVEKDLQKAADLLIEWMRSRGYLGAKLVTVNTAFAQPSREAHARGEPPAVRAILYLYEGEQTNVRSLVLAGNRAVGTDEIKRMLGVEERAPLNLFAFSEGIETLKAAYRARGYLDARITNEGTNQVVRYSPENVEADIRLDIDEGPLYHVTLIQVEGLVTTHEKVVRRELRFREGDVVEEPKLIESETRLRKLGIFGGVNFRVIEDPARPDGKIIKVVLQEGTPGVVAGGPGFRSDLGFRAFGEVSYNNLFGLNQSTFANVTVNRRIDDYHFMEYQAQVGYVYPWWLGIDELTFRPAITFSLNQYIDFSSENRLLSLTWERPLLHHPNLLGTFVYSIEGIRQFNAQTAFPAVDNQQLRIGSITPGLRLDLRDNPLSPTKGFYATSNFEIASPWFGSQGGDNPIGYTSFQFRADQFVPISANVTWYLSFRTGIERSFVGNDDPNSAIGAIPLSKQYTLGGAGSIRGFQEQELNYQSIAVKGTLSYVNYRTQLDLPFTGALRFGPFIDAGNLLIDHYSFGNLRWGTGMGFHYQTPVGPVNLDWGYNIFREPGEDPYRFYFSIGII